MKELESNKIKKSIYTIRNKQVMLDSGLAELYNVNTKSLNQAVKRNKDRFPVDFCFQLTQKEFDILRSQFVTANKTYSKIRYLPFVFTEQGVAMLSAILKSTTAIKISIQIISAFVSMRHFIMDNAQIFKRLDKVEIKQVEYDNKFEQVFSAIESKTIKPEKGIFFDGQIFDAYNFVSELVRSASSSIVLIDNYVDDSVLTLFNKRKECVTMQIFTRKISKQLALDLKKYNLQYPNVELKEFDQSHDRFLIIDGKDVYHFGASLKDLGKKWFAFSRFDKAAFKIFERLSF